jgi:hypothetical protein
MTRWTPAKHEDYPGLSFPLMGEGRVGVADEP